MRCTDAARILAVSALVSCSALAGKTALADAVTDWNLIALNATAVPPNSVLQSRTLAIVHAAIYDAVRSIDQSGRPYAVDLSAPAGTAVDAAIAAAAHGVLVRLAPAQRPMLDEAFKAAMSAIAPGQAKMDGISLGARIAEGMVARRTSDGADARVAFVPKSDPGYYQLTSGPAILVQWGNVKPFVLPTMEGLEFKGAPAPGSPEFAGDFDEIKSIGARNSTTRTADQTAAAIFWVAQTAVPWHAAARAASAAKGLSVAENARLFALLSFATADSQIVAMREKYSRPHWRPVTAIRAAADLDIATLKGDRTWDPLLVTPPHPEYPSAHAMFSGAAESALRAFFGRDDVNVSVTFPAPFGITRTFRAFSQITEEVDNARVWGGIHFRSADRDGSEIGRKIGTMVVREFLNTTTTD